MIPLKRNLKEISAVFIFSILFLLVVVMQQSCKKIDNQSQPATTPLAIDPEIKFFDLPANVDSSVKKVADKIKKQNEQKHFLARFVKTQGYALWDKAVKTTVSLMNSGSSQNGNGRSSITGQGNDELILIPLALQDSNKVHGALWCKVNGDSVSLKLLDGTKYNWYTNHPDSIGMTGEQVTLLLVKLDKAAFGDSLFKIKDSLAFGINVSRKAKYIKITNQTSSNATSNNASHTSRLGHWEYYDYSFSYVTYEPNLCGCDATPCPDGSMHEEYHTENYSGSIWVEDGNWYDPPAGGSGGGGGGGNGTGGSLNNDLPFDPVGNDPLDPIIEDFGLAQFIIQDFNSTGVSNPCITSVINEIGITGCQSYLLKLYQKLFSAAKIDKYKFTFIEDTLLIGNNGNSVASNTVINTLSNGIKEAVITINPKYLKNSSKEFIATVIIHEITHAFISFQHSNSTEKEQHYSMFNNDVDNIASAVRELYPSLTQQNARAMALQGMDEIEFDFTTYPVSVYNDANQTAITKYSMGIAEARNRTIPFLNGTAGTHC